MQHETFPKNSHNTHAPGQPPNIPAEAAAPLVSATLASHTRSRYPSDRAFAASGTRVLSP